MAADCWTICVCPCGFPLGAPLAVLNLRSSRCPDCGQLLTPIQTRTRSVQVEAVEDDGMGVAAGIWSLQEAAFIVVVGVVALCLVLLIATGGHCP